MQHCCAAVVIPLLSCRMLYAFSRDGAVPLSRWWSIVSKRFEAPVNAVWCVVLLCFILGLPMLHSYVAFAAITSIGVIGLYVSYLVSHWAAVSHKPTLVDTVESVGTALHVGHGVHV